MSFVWLTSYLWLIDWKALWAYEQSLDRLKVSDAGFGESHELFADQLEKQLEFVIAETVRASDYKS